LLFAAAIIAFGRHHGSRWRPGSASDPFTPSVTGYGEPIDGDSLWVGRDEVRLKGIDAPEWKQDCGAGGSRWACGEAARQELVRAIGGDDVRCAIDQRDVYGRLLGLCTAGGRDLNAEMVTSGMAVTFGGSYGNEQARARAERRGIWSGPFEEPRDWRAQHASETGR
jgi:endonuclease YncB( thermonuclease family)